MSRSVKFTITLPQDLYRQLQRVLVALGRQEVFHATGKGNLSATVRYLLIRGMDIVESDLKDKLPGESLVGFPGKYVRQDTPIDPNKALEDSLVSLDEGEDV